MKAIQLSWERGFCFSWRVSVRQGPQMPLFGLSSLPTPHCGTDKRGFTISSETYIASVSRNVRLGLTVPNSCSSPPYSSYLSKHKGERSVVHDAKPSVSATLFKLRVNSENDMKQMQPALDKSGI